MTTVKPPLPTQALSRARRLRRKMTDAERKLWSHLRGSQINGSKFRRQHPVPPYIADFCCVERRLIVELDGSQHSIRVDAARMKYLESQGFHLLRFWDNEVLLNMDSVLEVIWNAVAQPDPHPHPTTHPRGGGKKRGG